MTVKTMTLPEVGLNQAGVEGLSAQRREPDWFLDLRRRAWRFFEEIAWPTGNEEEWRRTRLTGLNIDEFRLPAPVEAAKSDLAGLPAYLREEMESIESAGALVTENGARATTS
jgi:Fe-S cluster assembly protein SufD